MLGLQKALYYLAYTIRNKSAADCVHTFQLKLMKQQQEQRLQAIPCIASIVWLMCVYTAW